MSESHSSEQMLAKSSDGAAVLKERGNRWETLLSVAAGRGMYQQRGRRKGVW